MCYDLTLQITLNEEKVIQIAQSDMNRRIYNRRKGKNSKLKLC